MAQHAGYHAWYASHTLKEDKTRDPLLLAHGVWCCETFFGCGLGPIAGDSIHAPAKSSYCSESYLVLPIPCLTMSCADGKDLFFCVSAG